MARTSNWLALGTAYVVALSSAAAATFPTIPGLPGFPLPQAASTAKLEALKANPDGSTASGVSSGAYMALQLVVAMSSKFQGAGLIAGGPWHCARGSASTAQDACMRDPSKIDVGDLVKETQNAAAKGLIENTKNLASAKFYVFGSAKDSVVKPPAADRLQSYLQAFTSANNVTVETSIPSGHGWPTENFGNTCEQMGMPWMNKCGYDTAGNVLTSLYGKLKPRAPSVATSLKTFDQSEFDAKGKATLGANGFVYVPKSCAAGNCRVHVALHGCQMSSDLIQDKFAVNSGLNEWAETNAIVVLYPQVKGSGGNPFGCWDWFGYTGAEYDTLKGEQVRAIRAMVDRLTSP